MSEVTGFSPLRFLIYVDDIPLTMLGDGDMGVERGGDDVSEKEGLYGDVMLSISPSKLYTVTFRLQASSADNKRMGAYREAMARDGTGFFRLRIVDVNDSAAKFFSPKAWVRRHAPFKRGKEAPDTEWTVGAANGALLHEGRSL